MSNIFADTDIKQALSDIAAATGAVIVPDATVSGTVTCELKDVPLEKALEIVLAAGGFTFCKMDGYYLVGLADPNNPNFYKLSTSEIVRCRYRRPEEIMALLPAYCSNLVKSSSQTNCLTVTGSAGMIERIKEDIAKVDTAPTQVLIEALVTELSATDSLEAGFSWNWKKFGVDSNLTLSYSSVGADDVAVLKALITHGKARIKANPRITTTDGNEGMINVGTEAYFAIVTGPVNFPYTTLQQIKTGITLRIVPYVAEGDELMVKLEPEVSDATGTGPTGLPINTVRKASSLVRVKDGETIALGGLIQEFTHKTTTKVPLLGDIPLVGQLFRRTQSSNTRTEVVILITPHILRDGTSPSGIRSPELEEDIEQHQGYKGY